jgi:hypothetical protein
MPVRKGAPPVKPTAPPIMRDIQGKPPVKPTTPPIMRDIKGKGVPVAPREPLIGRPEDSNNRGRASLGVRRPMR